MNIEKTNISQCEKKIVVKIPTEEIKKEYHSYLNKNKRFFPVPGFRPGKAPLSLVIKNFGEQYKDPFIKEKIYNLTEEINKDLDKNAYNEAKPIDYKWEEGEDFSLEFHYEVMPEIDIVKYKDIEVEFNYEELSEEIVDKEINNIRKENSEKELIDGPIEPGDNVHIDMVIATTYEELDSLESQNKSIPRQVVVSEKLYGEKFDSALIGKKINDKVRTVIEFTANDAPKDYHKHVSVTINKIERINLPELDDEFAKDLDHGSLDDMISEVRDYLKQGLTERNEANLKNKIIDTIYLKNKFDLPPSMIYQRAEMLASSYANQNSQDISSIFKYFLQIAFVDLARSIITEKLIEKESITITPEIIDSFVEDSAKKAEMSLEEFKETHKDEIKSENFVNLLKEEELFKKLKSYVKIVPVKEEEKHEQSKNEENSEETEEK